MSNSTERSRFPANRWVAILMFIWTLLAMVSLVWNLDEVDEKAREEARVHLKAIFNQDIVYRSWNAGHGGVYVPVSDNAQPNPYLSHIPDRDVTTTDGKQLTLMNPAYRRARCMKS